MFPNTFGDSRRNHFVILCFRLTECHSGLPYSSLVMAPGNPGFPRVQVGDLRADPICQSGVPATRASLTNRGVTPG